MKCGKMLVLAGLISLATVSVAPAWDYFSVGVSYDAPVVVRERVYSPAVVYDAPVVYAPRTVVYDAPVVYSAPVVYDAPVYVQPRPFFNFTYIGGHGGHRDYYYGRPAYRGGGGRYYRGGHH
jgi:hypothetical protein